MSLNKLIILLFSVSLFFSSCKEDPQANCPAEDSISSRFVQSSGEEMIIGKDGKVYIVHPDGCQYVMNYFNNDFRTQNYSESDGNINIITPQGNIPVVKNFEEDFESYEGTLDAFYTSLEQVGEKVWETLILQSPKAKTVDEYVALRKCILDGTCDFIDNRMDLVEDPKDATNTCMRFESVSKTEDMTTCKSSMKTPLLFFENGDDLWFSADYLIEGNIPSSLADFENDYFEGSPGPRILISGNKLTIENKFGDKEIYRHDRDITVPTNEWFNVKVHLKFSAENDGLIELWQDGIQLISANGKNLPLVNSIQNSLEVGISATELESTLFLDNVRIDHEAF